MAQPGGDGFVVEGLGVTLRVTRLDEASDGTGAGGGPIPAGTHWVATASRNLSLPERAGRPMFIMLGPTAFSPV